MLNYRLGTVNDFHWEFKDLSIYVQFYFSYRMLVGSPRTNASDPYNTTNTIISHGEVRLCKRLTGQNITCVKHEVNDGGVNKCSTYI